MTVESILNSTLVENVGSYNVIMQVDGVLYQFPYERLVDDVVIQREFDIHKLWQCFDTSDFDVIEDLRSVIMRYKHHFTYLLDSCAIEQSKLSYK